MQRTSFLDLVHCFQYDLWRVVDFGRTAGTLKKRPICSEKLRSIDWKDKMTDSWGSNTPGSGEFSLGGPIREHVCHHFYDFGY